MVFKVSAAHLFTGKHTEKVKDRKRETNAGQKERFGLITKGRLGLCIIISLTK